MQGVYFSQLISIQFKYEQSMIYLHIQTSFLPSFVAFEDNAHNEKTETKRDLQGQKTAPVEFLYFINAPAGKL